MGSPGTREPPRGLLRFYVGGIALAAAAAVAAAAVAAAAVAGADASAFARVPDLLIILAGLAFVSGARPVRFPWLRFQLTVTHPFIFLSVALLSPLDAVTVALAGLAGTLVAQRGTRRLIRLAFNAGSVTLATALAASCFRNLRGAWTGTGWEEFLPLVAAGALYFVVNTGLLAIAVGLERGRRSAEVWRDGFRWTAASYFAGMSAAAMLLALVRAFGPWSVALGIAPCWLLVAFYESHRETLAERERRIEAVEKVNAGLEIKVAERTAALEEANRRLTEANARIVETSRTKSEFIANISHELRTPLNAVIGFSEYLAGPDFDNLTESQRGFLGDIRDSGEHLLQLINDLLDFVKIEAGKTEIHRETVEPAGLLREATAMLRVAAERKSLALSWSCEPGVDLAELDPKLAKQVLINLLSNAVKFTPEEGRVTVRARGAEGDLVVEVEDDGIGIPAEHLPRIFEEFHQVDGTYARKHQGTGLGLALVNRMVAMHGGTVAARSQPGRGSTFTCVFPGAVRQRPAEAIGVGEAPVAATAVRPERGNAILVVEDNTVSRKLARNMLRSCGYEVIEAASGEEALDALERVVPALVLMDIQMPGLDGLEVARRIKSDPRTSRVPIVAVSAQVAAADEERARDAGCDGYVVKPIRLATLPGQIAAYLEGVA